jgi:hypothetical protein
MAHAEKSAATLACGPSFGKADASVQIVDRVVLCQANSRMLKRLPKSHCFHLASTKHARSASRESAFPYPQLLWISMCTVLEKQS